MFHGLPSEDPIDHLDEFDRLCDLTKINGVSEDAIKLRLFPMSLADKAHQWEKSLPHGTITTWDECKKAFLAKFFSTGRTAKLRGEISSFIQRTMRHSQRLGRGSKGYTSQCPHHGFNNESLLSTLYRGCLPRYREMLDTASNGNFLNQDVDDGWQLVENMAISTECYGDNMSTDWSSTALDRAGGSDEKRHACTQLEVGQTDPSPIPCQACLCLRTNLVKDQEGEETTTSTQKDKDHLWSHNQACGYKSIHTDPTSKAPPKFPPRIHQCHTQPSQDWDMKEMLQQLLQGQAKGSLEMNNKLVEIHSKLESLTSRVQIIESSSASSSSPQEYAQAVTLRSGRQFQAENSIELEKLRLQDKPELDRAEKRTDKASSSQPAKPVAKKKDTPAGPPPYKPPLPFPGRFKKQLLEAHKAKFDELMRQLELKLPFIDALMLIPPYQKFLKDAVQQRTREAQGMVVLTRECSAIIQRKVISDKKEDPGSFTLPCMLGPLSFKNSLCDLGSSVSLMPLSVAKRLGYHKYQACGISLVLADRSIRLPTGMLEDLPLRIGNVEIPTDFIVLEMDEEPTDPLILGRPFLATARAMIDVCEGTIELNLGKDLR
ncbi:unnamed protein product [Microthlaspi erraticum]|uniref:Retrotransposon gag domain-containing protein n=1 Tax=Microthlaspi erraticum TaxID=1685480 RepID=A0A6D2JJ20_9BRAS|nr:unnamed protein product [Microthlaspi erraticum]